VNQTQKLLRAFLVPAVVGTYLVFFWRSTSGMPLGGQGVPRLLIGAIAILLVAIVVAQVVRLRRGDLEPSAAEQPPAAVDADTAGGEFLEPASIAVDDRVSGPSSAAGSPSAVATSVRPMVAIIVSLLAFWLLLPRIGAYPTTALFVVGLSVALGYRRWLLIALSAVVCVVIVYSFIRIFTLPLSGFGPS
jgi:Tripartite tricarboxylate transporter TctB family